MTKRKSIVQDMVQQEVYMGRLPILTNERIYDFKAVTLTCAGIGIASWCYTQGGWVAACLPIHMAIFVTLIPMIAMAMVMMPISTLSTRYGVENSLLMQSTFGYKLMKIIFIILIATGTGWYAINAKLFASSMINLGGFLGYSLGNQLIPWLATICIIGGSLLAVNGPQLLKKSLYIMVPCLLGVGVLLMIKVATTTSWAELTAVTPMYIDLYPTLAIAFIIMVDGFFAFVFSWFPVLGQFARLSKTEGGAFWGHTLGYAVVMGAFVCIGIFTSTLMASMGTYSDDPTEWMMLIGGPFWGVLSMLAIALANITTQATGMYCWTIVTKELWPTLKYRTIVMGYCVWLILLVFWGGIWNFYSVFLAIIAVTCGVSCAVVLSDFYLVRKAKFSLKSIYRIKEHKAYTYSAGFNIIAILCMILGAIFYFAVYDPINYMPRNNSILFYMTPTGVSFIVTFVSYSLISRIPFIKEYLLRDRNEIMQIEDKQRQ